MRKRCAINRYWFGLWPLVWALTASAQVQPTVESFSWTTLVAYVSLFFALGGALLLLYWLRTYRLVKRQEDLERLVAERTSELARTNQKLDAANRELQALAHQDGLTGLANKRYFSAKYHEEYARARRSGKPLSMIMIDVDCFKSYNDNNGHLAGDDCLKQVAGAIRQSVGRSTDLAARYGGEEFVIMLPETTGDQAFELAEKIRCRIAELDIPHENSEAAAFVTASFGVATLVPDGRQLPDALIAQADIALYRAKRAGRNRVEGQPLSA